MSRDILISKIAGSSLPSAITRWMSCHLRGRQAAISFENRPHRRPSRIQVVTFTVQLLHSCYANSPVKRVCYADDITVWASGPEIPQLESMINSYLRDVGIYLKENSLLISALKSTVTLFTPDTHQFQTHTDIALVDTQLPLERSPKILGAIMDPSLSFHKHCNYVTGIKCTGRIILRTGE